MKKLTTNITVLLIIGLIFAVYVDAAGAYTKNTSGNFLAKAICTHKLIPTGESQYLGAFLIGDSYGLPSLQPNSSNEIEWRLEGASLITYDIATTFQNTAYDANAVDNVQVTEWDWYIKDINYPTVGGGSPDYVLVTSEPNNLNLDEIWLYGQGCEATAYFKIVANHLTSTTGLTPGFYTFVATLTASVDL